MKRREFIKSLAVAPQPIFHDQSGNSHHLYPVDSAPHIREARGFRKIISTYNGPIVTLIREPNGERRDFYADPITGKIDNEAFQAFQADGVVRVICHNQAG